MNADELRRLIEEYLQTLDDVEEDAYYPDTARGYARNELEQFVKWVASPVVQGYPVPPGLYVVFADGSERPLTGFVVSKQETIEEALRELMCEAGAVEIRSRGGNEVEEATSATPPHTTAAPVRIV